MPNPYDQIASILTRYISPIMAQGLLSRALRECGVTRETMTASDIPFLCSKLHTGIRLFAEPSLQKTVWAELEALSGGNVRDVAQHIVLSQESDIADARARARLACERLGASPLVQQRVVTIVSELARNIVSYTPGGHLDIDWEQATPRRKLKILAVDTGPGIPNLDEILAGRYRSRTGLGKGILGVKRLADAFDIQTSSRGTRIEVAVLI